MSWMGETKVKEALIGSIHLLKRIPGYSAYEIAVKNGFVGTEKEWLASLKGEKGDIGQMEAHGGIDALGKRVKNVADPVEDGDAVNKKHFDGVVAGSLEYVNAKVNEMGAEAKKYVDDKNVASQEYVDQTFIKKGEQLDANSKIVKNVADPVSGTDAVNKQYADSKFVGNAIENISDDFIKTVNNGITVANKSVFKQGNIISGSVTIRGNLNQTDILYLFQIRTNYKPKATFYCPSKMTTYADSNYNESAAFYLKEAPNVWIDSLLGGVYANGLGDLNEGFANEIEFGFTYLSE